MNSFTFAAGTFGFTTSTLGVEATCVTAMKSFSALYGMLGYRLGLMAWVATAPMRMVCPSGAARATTPAPMLPPAPGTLSTTTGCLMLAETFCPRRRATVFSGPPGG